MSYNPSEARDADGKWTSDAASQEDKTHGHHHLAGIHRAIKAHNSARIHVLKKAAILAGGAYVGLQAAHLISKITP